MRAIAVSSYGADPQVMDLPMPEPAPDEVVVRLHAASYNSFDLMVADGDMKDTVPASFPMILGSDGAGVVDAVGSDVTAFAPGDRVYGVFLHAARGLGSYAEYGVARQSGPIAAMPRGMIFEQAAAVPLATLAAYDMVRSGMVDEDQTVLVVGATGGVGQAAVQLAALQGARVIATARPGADGLVKELGATETVDYSARPVPDQVLAISPGGVDAILDVVTPPDGVNALAGLLRPGGVYVSTIGSLDPRALAAREIRGVNLVGSHHARDLAALADMIDAGNLRVNIEAQVSMDEAPAMLRQVAKGGARGKYVIRL
ncbi:MAG: zinc-binding dehydrogenase [Streptosporangiales bacterium]|nr:zinc-binding dehydrogenase [Streptosporangiales bacterium]